MENDRSEFNSHRQSPELSLVVKSTFLIVPQRLICRSLGMQNAVTWLARIAYHAPSMTDNSLKKQERKNRHAVRNLCTSKGL